MGCVVIAVCSDCIVLSVQASAAGADGVFANLSAFRLVGKLVSATGRGRKIAALQKKGGGHTLRYLPPKKGRRRKEVCPPRIDTHTETVRKRLTKRSNPSSTPPHSGGQCTSRKAPYRPESGSTKVSANASMKASRPCSVPRKGWPGYLNRKGSYQETYASCLSRPCAVGTTDPNQREKQGGQVFTTHHPLMKAPHPCL